MVVTFCAGAAVAAGVFPDLLDALLPPFPPPLFCGPEAAADELAAASTGAPPSETVGGRVVSEPTALRTALA